MKTSSLSLSRNSRGHDKKVIGKFINRKYLEACCWRIKNELVVKTSGICILLTKFLYLPPFAHSLGISGPNVRICKGKGRYTKFTIWRRTLSVSNYQRMEAWLNSFISVIFLTSLRTRILEINFCKYSTFIIHLFVVKPSL